MTTWLNETRLVEQIAENLLMPKKTRYQEDLIRYTALKAKRLQFKNHSVHNKYGEQLRATVFLPQFNQSNCCVIYLHGYGSHRLEGLSILSALPSEFGLCCFDFSGSGKSEGEISTYGIKQSEDIASIIQMLKISYKFKKFILWGRSMGAVASILYTCNQNTNKDIYFQVLDSPFSSFESISIHHAKNIIKLPMMFINLGISIVKQHMKVHRFNPYDIKMCQTVKQCKVPALFVYCQEDKIIPQENSLQILQNFPENTLYEKLIIPEDHNTFRSKNTLENIVEILTKYIAKQKIKQKIKHRKGFMEIFSSVTPTARDNKSSHKKFPGFIQCSLSKKKNVITKNNPQQSKKNKFNPSICGVSFSCSTLKQQH